MRWRVPVSGVLGTLGAMAVLTPPVSLVTRTPLPGAPSHLFALGSRLVADTSAPHTVVLYSTEGSLRPLATLALPSGGGELAVTGSNLWSGSPTSPTLTRIPWNARGFGTPSAVTMTSPIDLLVGVSPSTLLVAESDRRLHAVTNATSPLFGPTSPSLPAEPTLAQRVSTSSAWFAYPHSNEVTRATVGSSISLLSRRVNGVVSALSAGPGGSLLVGLATRPSLQVVSATGSVSAPLTFTAPGATRVLSLASSSSTVVALLATRLGDVLVRSTLTAGRLEQSSPTPLYAVSNETLVTPQPTALAATNPSTAWYLDGAGPALAEASVRHTSAPLLLEPPRITDASSHHPTVGDTLRATTGTWSGARRDTFVWYRCAASVTPADSTRLLDPRSTKGCSAIPRATSATYVTTSADAATHVLVVVSAVSARGTLARSPSPWTPLLTSPPIQELALPSISDVTSLNYRTGDVVHLAPGTWLNATSFTYQWFQCTNGVCSTPIPGATSLNYVLQPGDAGHQIDAEVIASSPVTPSVSRTTALSPPIV